MATLPFAPSFKTIAAATEVGLARHDKDFAVPCRNLDRADDETRLYDLRNLINATLTSSAWVQLTA